MTFEELLQAIKVAKNLRSRLERLKDRSTTTTRNAEEGDKIDGHIRSVETST